MLQARHIIQTAVQLRARIEERFPGSSLTGVADEVRDQAERTEAKISALQRPNWYLRAVNVVLVAGIMGIGVYLITHFPLRMKARDIEGVIQFIEPALGSMVFIGAFVLFLWGLENRWRRQQTLAAVHHLRSLAHVIDMHQLTKDPERLLMVGPDTRASPKRTMNRFELGRYLDYCSELLSVLSKVAALWSRESSDSETLRAIDQIENLTSGLARKIWQKMMILTEMERSVQRSDS